MPDENQQPNQQPDSSVAPQVVQPTNGSTGVSPSSLSSESQPAVPAPITQSAGMVNGQPLEPTTPMSDSQPEQMSEQKSWWWLGVFIAASSFFLPAALALLVYMMIKKQWDRFFIALCVLQVLGVALFFGMMFSLGGQTGGEFVALLLFVTLVPAVALVALINLIGLPIYMIKHKTRGKGFAFGVVSLVISLALFSFGAWNLYQARVVAPKRIDELSERSRQKFEEQDRQFAAANAKPEITKEEAIELLKSCKLKGFYYTNQTDKSDPANGGWGELSSTGVVLTKVDGQPYRISIADKLIPELVPIAREAQKTCGGPQFWHDGMYEQYKDGKWYFRSEVVNSTQSGKTKEEAVSFMQSCKADYFVGYTDINLVKDSTTKAWLNKAEKSGGGIEISESSPRSYVFASKAMTTALQDTARQFRQSCYSTKKLYIAIDNWIETEYPVGQWTRVNQ